MFVVGALGVDVVVCLLFVVVIVVVCLLFFVVVVVVNVVVDVGVGARHTCVLALVCGPKKKVVVNVDVVVGALGVVGYWCSVAGAVGYVLAL